MMLKAPLPTETQQRNSLDTDMDSPRRSPSGHAQQSSQSSTSSDFSSPTQSLFSNKGSSNRFSSSASSLTSSPVLRESLDGFGPPKTTLTEVKEEPQEQEDVEMSGCAASSYEAFDSYHSDIDPARSPLALGSSPEYDLGDKTFGDTDLHSTSSFKKRKSGESALSGMTARIGTRFPSLSKKWKNKAGPDAVLSIESLSDSMRSRNSSTSSTVISPAVSALSKHDSHLPPSPARTVFEERISEAGVAPIDIEKANSQPIEDVDQGQATTPLLPPLMMDFPTHQTESPVQSPLQSPTVAEAPASSTLNTPTEAQHRGLPSPPLSTKPSLASMHTRSRAGTTVPSAEMPALSMVSPLDGDDKWSQLLGHANFTIHPEPYRPEVFDMDSFRQFRANWELARCNYAKHLARTGEHNGTTSKTYKLTEEKWAEADAEWKRINTLMASNLEGSSAAAMRDISPHGSGPAPTVKVPKLDDPSGKFPELGDEDIVGPMAVEPPKSPVETVQPRSRKRSFFRFLSDLLGRPR